MTVALAVALVGCTRRPPPAPLPPAPSFLSGPACFSYLAQQGVVFKPAKVEAAPACAVPEAVTVERAVVPWNRPSITSCSLAAQTDRFTREVIVPAAARTMGRSLARLHHFGTYACRGRSSAPSRLSEHATGKAIDVAAFELDDGTMIKVVDDWATRGPRGQFLREVAREACRYFSVVLTPDSDSDHYNHFHFDVGPSRACP